MFEVKVSSSPSAVRRVNSVLLTISRFDFAPALCFKASTTGTRSTGGLAGNGYGRRFWLSPWPSVNEAWNHETSLSPSGGSVKSAVATPSFGVRVRSWRFGLPDSGAGGASARFLVVGAD